MLSNWELALKKYGMFEEEEQEVMPIAIADLTEIRMTPSNYKMETFQVNDIRPRELIRAYNYPEEEFNRYVFARMKDDLHSHIDQYIRCSVEDTYDGNMKYKIEIDLALQS